MSMSLRDYHKICDHHLARWNTIWVPTNGSIKPWSIRHSSRMDYEGSLEVASSDFQMVDADWATMDPIVENYWHP
jgi:hypothetical protein